MAKWLRTICSGIACATPLWGMAIVLLMMPHSVRDAQLTAGGRVYPVTVMTQQQLHVSGTAFLSGTIYQQPDGSLMVLRGIMGGKGRWPIIIREPANATERALYHQVF